MQIFDAASTNKIAGIRQQMCLTAIPARVCVDTHSRAYELLKVIHLQHFRNIGSEISEI